MYNRLQEKEASEEIVQEVFVSLWVNRQSFRLLSSLNSYLFGAVKKQLLQNFRSEGIRSEYASRFATFRDGVFDNSNNEHIELQDLREAIDEAIDKLPAKCKEAFWLSRRQHLPIAEIAEQMNISTKTVENYLTTSLKHLRNSLGDFLTIILIWECTNIVKYLTIS